MTEESDRECLAQLIDGLSGAAIGQLVQIAETLAAPISSVVNEAAGLMVPAFREEFEARLKVHHATHSKQLDRISLEDAFRAASLAAGRTVGGPSSATTSYIDETIDGEGVAIKSTAAKDVRPDRVHISKLCEASWIQDVRGAQAREAHAKELIRDFLSHAHRIFQLRVLPDSAEWRYQLVEVPVELFYPILEVDRAQFAPDGPRIPVADAIGRCLTLVLDRSDAKVTIAAIPISRCVIHGVWTLPKKQGDLGAD